MNETDFLAEFGESRSEGAFAEIVRRYTNLVYSVARRRVANDAMAQEVAQIVFIRLAKAELAELRHLALGKQAPEIEGKDLDDHEMRLSDHRGKVVVLVFWGKPYSEASEHQKLAERMVGRPFAVLGVLGDSDLTPARAIIEQAGITWPSFADGRGGPIWRAWNIHSWTSVYVLDAQGVIRHRDLRGTQLERAVEALLRE